MLQHDGEQVWSGAACDGGHLSAAGGTHRGAEACPDECDVPQCVCSPQCNSDSESHAVRCCADVAGTSCPAGGAEPTCDMPPPALTITDANDVGGCGPTLLESPTTTAASNCDRAYILGEGFADFLSTYTSAKSGPLFLLQVSTFDVCTKCHKLITFAVCLLSECTRPQ